ncbi:hypothetical protein PTKIN_Ptkin02bG0016900 [Pterospermum kingtungense]
MFISLTLLYLAISFSDRMKTGPVLEAGESSNEATPKDLMFNGVAMLEFTLRIFAVGGTLGSAMAMGTTQETVPLFPQAILLNAEYSDLPMFKFFVVANSVACAYLVLSLPLSFYHIFRRGAKRSRIILVMFDTVKMMIVIKFALFWSIIFVSRDKSQITLNI